MLEFVGKVAVICIVVTLLAQLLYRNTPEMALLLILAAVAVVMGFAMSWYREVRELLVSLMEESGLAAELFAPLLKIVAISLVSRLGSDVCQDGGQKAMASIVDVVGTLCALLASEPLLRRAVTMLMQLGGMG